jgi:hypothetical protein
MVLTIVLKVVRLLLSMEDVIDHRGYLRYLVSIFLQSN